MAKPANLFVPASFTACTNSTAEVVMGTVTIPAYFLRAPYKLGFSYAVQTPATNSTDQFMPRVRVLGTTTAVSGSPPVQVESPANYVAAKLASHDVVNNEVIDGQGEGSFAPALSGQTNGKLQVRSLTASSIVATLGGEHLVDLELDPNFDVVFQLTGQWTVANAGNNAVAKEFIITLQPLVN